MERMRDIVILTTNELEGEGLGRVLAQRSFIIRSICRNLDEVLSLHSWEHDPPVVLIASLEGTGSSELCKHVKSEWPESKVVLLAQDCSASSVGEALRAGADGYVCRDTSPASLAEMLKLISLGERLVPSRTLDEIGKFKADSVLNDPDIGLSEANISGREVDILKGLIRGEPNKVISRRLAITEATVKVHVKSILRKLNVMNRTQAAIWAVSRGLVAEVDIPIHDGAVRLPPARQADLKSMEVAAQGPGRLLNTAAACRVG